MHRYSAGNAVMKAELKKRLQGILVLAGMAGLLFGIFYGTYHGPWDPTLRRIAKESEQAYKKNIFRPPVPKGRTVLRIGEPQTVDGVTLVYRGIQDGELLIDLTVLALDPDAAYPYRIPIRRAGQGLRLGGETFKLVSHGKRQLTISSMHPESR
jgi:hypothetical protein